MGKEILLSDSARVLNHYNLKKMADSTCQNACRAFYQTTIDRLNNVLLENLVLADGDAEEIKKAKEKFSKGMKLAKEVLNTCLAECDV